MWKELNVKILDYSEIPEGIAQGNTMLSEAPCDVYVEYNITPKERQAEFDDDFELDNWITESYPELEGEKIMIHMDY